MQDLRRDLVSLEGQDLNAFVKEGFITEDRQLFVQNSVLPNQQQDFSRLVYDKFKNDAEREPQESGDRLNKRRICTIVSLP